MTPHSIQPQAQAEEQRRPLRAWVVWGAAMLTLTATAWTAFNDAQDERLGANLSETASEHRPVPAEPSQRRASDADAVVARVPWPQVTDAVSQSWGETPSTNAPVVASSPPQAAAATLPSSVGFPYQLVGRFDDHRPRVVLVDALRTHVVAAGELLDGAWRLERIDADAIQVRHLPAGAVQTLPFPTS